MGFHVTNMLHVTDTNVTRNKKVTKKSNNYADCDGVADKTRDVAYKLIFKITYKQKSAHYKQTYNEIIGSNKITFTFIQTVTYV